MGVFATGGRPGGVRTLLQPARAQCLRLSELFFLLGILAVITEEKLIDRHTGVTIGLVGGRRLLTLNGSGGSHNMRLLPADVRRVD